MICDRVILREQGYFVGDRWVFTEWLIETTGGQPLFSSPFLGYSQKYVELTQDFHKKEKLMQGIKQLGLFDQKSYVVPRFVEGQEVMVYDADDWERFNGAFGIIISAPIPYYGYDVKLENGLIHHFHDREIMRR